MLMVVFIVIICKIYTSLYTYKKPAFAVVCISAFWLTLIYSLLFGLTLIEPENPNIKEHILTEDIKVDDNGYYTLKCKCSDEPVVVKPVKVKHRDASVCGEKAYKIYSNDTIFDDWVNIFFFTKLFKPLIGEFYGDILVLYE